MTATVDADALTALVTVLDVALSVPVLDGPQQTELSVPVYVVVGHDDDPDTNEAVLTDQVASDLSLVTRQEKGQVNCYIVAQFGDDTAALRLATRNTLANIGAALAANPTLSGAVQRAELGTQSLLKQEPTPDGVTAVRVFTVAYTASV